VKTSAVPSFDKRTLILNVTHRHPDDIPIESAFLMVRRDVELITQQLPTANVISLLRHHYASPMAARSRPRNGGELPAKPAPPTSFMLVPPTLTSQ
jgi:hypothetical protein